MICSLSISAIIFKDAKVGVRVASLLIFCKKNCCYFERKEVLLHL